MARRDFTINAMARRLDGRRRSSTPSAARRSRAAHDPHRRADELRGGSTAPRSRASLRLPTRLRRRTRDAWRRWTRRVRARARLGRANRRRDQGRRDGRAVEAPPRPRTRSGRSLLARDTGVLVEVIPEFIPTIGYSLHSRAATAATRGAHLRRRAERRRRRRPPRRPARLPPPRSREGRGGARQDEPRAPRGRESHAASSRGSATRQTCSTRSSRIVAGHAFGLDGPIDELRARRFLAEHGDELAFDLIAHKRADLNAKPVPASRARGACEPRAARRATAVATAPHRRPRGDGRRPARDRISRGPEGRARARNAARRRRRPTRPGTSGTGSSSVRAQELA